jgi:hypothetical protein
MAAPTHDEPDHLAARREMIKLALEIRRAHHLELITDPTTGEPAYIGIVHFGQLPPTPPG